MESNAVWRYTGAPDRIPRPGRLFPGFSWERRRRIAEWKWIGWALFIAWWWLPTLFVVWVFWSAFILGREWVNLCYRIWS